LEVLYDVDVLYPYNRSPRITLGQIQVKDQG